MQKGRPPKNPIEKLKVKTLFSAIRMFNSELKNGYQLEKYFEPHLIVYKDGVTQRSCKWDRYLTGTTPSKREMCLIEDQYPRAVAYYNLPLWVALKAGKQSDKYWGEFYFLVDEELRNLCYQFKSTKNVSSFNVGKQKHKIIDKLIRIGSKDTLACLIALLRESINHQNITEHDALETALFNSVFWTLGTPPFYVLNSELFDYFNRYIFRVGIEDHPFIRPTPWNLSYSDIEKRIWIDHKNITMAEDIGVLISHIEIQDFMYWKLKGNSQLIIQEIVNALYVKQYQLPDSDKGLKWLIKKLK